MLITAAPVAACMFVLSEVEVLEVREFLSVSKKDVGLSLRKTRPVLRSDPRFALQLPSSSRLTVYQEVRSVSGNALFLIRPDTITRTFSWRCSLIVPIPQSRWRIIP